MFWKSRHERSRLRSVQRLDLVDAPADVVLDRFVERAAQAFAAPISLLTLLHDEQLCVKASTGFAVECLPRKDSLCNYAVDRKGLLEVCDAQLDPFFRHLPPVTGEPHVRYYIGAPLTLSNRMDVGVLCVVDLHPRPPASRDQRAYLIGLARQATDAIEHRAHLRRAAAA